jgi:hypothetical protein
MDELLDEKSDYESVDNIPENAIIEKNPFDNKTYLYSALDGFIDESTGNSIENSLQELRELMSDGIVTEFYHKINSPSDIDARLPRTEYITFQSLLREAKDIYLKYFEPLKKMRLMKKVNDNRHKSKNDEAKTAEVLKAIDENTGEIVKKIHRNLRVMLPGGYGSRHGGHLIGILLENVFNGDYKITIVNSGEGINYHGLIESPQYGKDILQTNAIITYTVKEEVLSSFIKANFLFYTKMTTNIDMYYEFCLSILSKESLDNTNGELTKINLLNDEERMVFHEQITGSCTFHGFFYVLAYIYIKYHKGTYEVFQKWYDGIKFYIINKFLVFFANNKYIDEYKFTLIKLCDKLSKAYYDKIKDSKYEVFDKMNEMNNGIIIKLKEKYIECVKKYNADEFTGIELSDEHLGNTIVPKMKIFDKDHTHAAKSINKSEATGSQNDITNMYSKCVHDLDLLDGIFSGKVNLNDSLTELLKIMVDAMLLFNEKNILQFFFVQKLNRIILKFARKVDSGDYIISDMVQCLKLLFSTLQHYKFYELKSNDIFDKFSLHGILWYVIMFKLYIDANDCKRLSHPITSSLYSSYSVMTSEDCDISKEIIGLLYKYADFIPRATDANNTKVKNVMEFITNEFAYVSLNDAEHLASDILYKFGSGHNIGKLKEKLKNTDIKPFFNAVGVYYYDKFQTKEIDNKKMMACYLLKFAVFCLYNTINQFGDKYDFVPSDIEYFVSFRYYYSMYREETEYPVECILSEHASGNYAKTYATKFTLSNIINTLSKINYNKNYILEFIYDNNADTLNNVNGVVNLAVDNIFCKIGQYIPHDGNICELNKDIVVSDNIALFYDDVSVMHILKNTFYIRESIKKLIIGLNEYKNLLDMRKIVYLTRLFVYLFNVSDNLFGLGKELENEIGNLRDFLILRDNPVTYGKINKLDDLIFPYLIKIMIVQLTIILANIQKLNKNIIEQTIRPYLKDLFEWYYIYEESKTKEYKQNVKVKFPVSQLENKKQQQRRYNYDDYGYDNHGYDDDDYEKPINFEMKSRFDTAIENIKEENARIRNSYSYSYSSDRKSSINEPNKFEQTEFLMQYEYLFKILESNNMINVNYQPNNKYILNSIKFVYDKTIYDLPQICIIEHSNGNVYKLLGTEIELIIGENVEEEFDPLFLKKLETDKLPQHNDQTILKKYSNYSTHSGSIQYPFNYDANKPTKKPSDSSLHPSSRYVAPPPSFGSASYSSSYSSSGNKDKDHVPGSYIILTDTNELKELLIYIRSYIYVQLHKKTGIEYIYTYALNRNIWELNSISYREKKIYSKNNEYRYSSYSSNNGTTIHFSKADNKYINNNFIENEYLRNNWVLWEKSSGVYFGEPKNNKHCKFNRYCILIDTAGDQIKISKCPYKYKNKSCSFDSDDIYKYLSIQEFGSSKSFMRNAYLYLLNICSFTNILVWSKGNNTLEIELPQYGLRLYYNNDKLYMEDGSLILFTTNTFIYNKWIASTDNVFILKKNNTYKLLVFNKSRSKIAEGKAIEKDMYMGSRSYTNYNISVDWTNNAGHSDEHKDYNRFGFSSPVDKYYILDIHTSGLFLTCEDFETILAYRVSCKVASKTDCIESTQRLYEQLYKFKFGEKGYIEGNDSVINHYYRIIKSVNNDPYGIYRGVNECILLNTDEITGKLDTSEAPLRIITKYRKLRHYYGERYQIDNFSYKFDQILDIDLTTDKIGDDRISNAELFLNSLRGKFKKQVEKVRDASSYNFKNIFSKTMIKYIALYFMKNEIISMYNNVYKEIREVLETLLGLQKSPAPYKQVKPRRHREYDDDYGYGYDDYGRDDYYDDYDDYDDPTKSDKYNESDTDDEHERVFNKETKEYESIVHKNEIMDDAAMPLNIINIYLNNYLFLNKEKLGKDADEIKLKNPEIKSYSSGSNIEYVEPNVKLVKLSITIPEKINKNVHSSAELLEKINVKQIQNPQESVLPGIPSINTDIMLFLSNYENNQYMVPKDKLKTLYNNLKAQHNTSINSLDDMIISYLVKNKTIDLNMIDELYTMNEDIQEIIFSSIKLNYLSLIFDKCGALFEDILDEYDCSEIVKLTKIKPFYGNIVDNIVLLYEFSFGYYIKGSQIELINRILDDINKNDKIKIHQMLMGGGKSSVIAPLTTLYLLAQQNHNSVLHVMPSSLINQSNINMIKYIGNVFEFPLRSVSINRQHKDISFLERKNRIYLMSDTSLKSLKLNNIVSFEKLNELKAKMDKNVIIMDEIDDMADSKKSELNYPIGEETVINNVYLRIKFIYDMIFAIYFDKEYNNVRLKMIDDKLALSEPHFYLIEYVPKVILSYIEKIIMNIIKTVIPFHTKINWDKFFEKQIETKSELSINEIQMLSIIYHIVHDILPTVMTKINRRHFGIDLQGIKEKRNYIAIPFTSVETPSENSEFTDPDLTIAFTVIAYNDIHSHQLRLTDIDAYLTSLYNSYIGDTSNALNRQSYKKYVKITENIKGTIKPLPLRPTINDFENEQLKSMKSDINLITYYLTEIIFPKYCKAYETQYNLSFNDVMISEFCASRTGFTGTPFVDIPLERTTKKYFDGIAMEYGSDGAICSSILGLVDKVPMFHYEKQIMEYIMDKDLNYSALIDVGAIFLNKLSRDVAKDFLMNFIKSKSKIECVVFIDADHKKKAYVKDSDDPIDLDHVSVPLAKRFVFFDQAHIVGTDIKLHANAHGLVTVKHYNRYRDVVQGIFRLRNINYGQTVDFYMNEILYNKIIGDSPNKNTVFLKWLISEEDKYSTGRSHHFYKQNANTLLRTELESNELLEINGKHIYIENANSRPPTSKEQITFTKNDWFVEDISGLLNKIRNSEIMSKIVDYINLLKGNASVDNISVQFNLRETENESENTQENQNQKEYISSNKIFDNDGYIDVHEIEINHYITLNQKTFMETKLVDIYKSKWHMSRKYKMYGYLEFNDLYTILTHEEIYSFIQKLKNSNKNLDVVLSFYSNENQLIYRYGKGKQPSKVSIGKMTVLNMTNDVKFIPLNKLLCARDYLEQSNTELFIEYMQTNINYLQTPYTLFGLLPHLKFKSEDVVAAIYFVNCLAVMYKGNDFFNMSISDYINKPNELASLRNLICEYDSKKNNDFRKLACFKFCKTNIDTMGKYLHIISALSTVNKIDYVLTGTTKLELPYKTLSEFLKDKDRLRALHIQSDLYTKV